MHESICHVSSVDGRGTVLQLFCQRIGLSVWLCNSLWAYWEEFNPIINASEIAPYTTAAISNFWKSVEGEGRDLEVIWRLRHGFSIHLFIHWMSIYFLTRSKINNPKADGNNHICLLVKKARMWIYIQMQI